MKSKLLKELKLIAGYLYAAVFVLISVFEIYTAVKLFGLIGEATGWWVLLLFATAISTSCWVIFLIRYIGKTCFVGLKIETEEEYLEESSGEDCGCTFEELLADELCKEESEDE